MSYAEFAEFVSNVPKCEIYGVHFSLYLKGWNTYSQTQQTQHEGFLKEKYDD